MTADEIKIEIQNRIFTSHKRALELCEDMETLKKVFLAVNKHKLNITAEQLKELTRVKDDMKTEIEKRN